MWKTGHRGSDHSQSEQLCTPVVQAQLVSFQLLLLSPHKYGSYLGGLQCSLECLTQGTHDLRGALLQCLCQVFTPHLSEGYIGAEDGGFVTSCVTGSLITSLEA
jgi:hypothetical protein